MPKWKTPRFGTAGTYNGVWAPGPLACGPVAQLNQFVVEVASLPSPGLSPTFPDSSTRDASMSLRCLSRSPFTWANSAAMSYCVPCSSCNMCFSSLTCVTSRPGSTLGLSGSFFSSTLLGCLGLDLSRPVLSSCCFSQSPPLS